MIRSIKDDYSALLMFIGDYSIKDTYDANFLDLVIKPMHRSYYSALVMCAELQHQKIKPPMSLTSNHEEQEQLFWLHLSECFSELGSSFFLVINGCYKASGQVLRSSIENFVKSIGGLDNIGINKIKNVYEVFERSSAAGFFSLEYGKEAFGGATKLYSELCSTVHTGTPKDMQKISALGDFPVVDLDKAVYVKNIYTNIVTIYVSTLSVMFAEAFHKTHHTNRDIVQESLSPKALKLLHVA